MSLAAVRVDSTPTVASHPERSLVVPDIISPRGMSTGE
jgi:hypothetical protein